MTTLGDRLRAVRKERGLTLHRLSELSGLSPGAISDIERRRQQGTRKLAALAAALNVRAEWLESGRGPREDAPGVVTPAVTAIAWDAPITREEAQLGVEWGKLDEPARSQIRVMIESLVAQQKKAGRKGKGAPKSGGSAARGSH